VIAAGVRTSLVDAMKHETSAFLRLAGGPESKRLIESFFASRKKS
jgi:hypothetical protein